MLALICSRERTSTRSCLETRPARSDRRLDRGFV
uniref:Uncharacterized protein n=1 Tax=Timema douglasi TaxID=61478 RepID=A0A7R8VZE8_TIMDO|nr:unnamed protein product [Timema douglasi]